MREIQRLRAEQEAHAKSTADAQYNFLLFFFKHTWTSLITQSTLIEINTINNQNLTFEETQKMCHVT
jgi:hypothetical protein